MSWRGNSHTLPVNPARLKEDQKFPFHSQPITKRSCYKQPIESHISISPLKLLIAAPLVGVIFYHRKPGRAGIFFSICLFELLKPEL